MSRKWMCGGDLLITLSVKYIFDIKYINSKTERSVNCAKSLFSGKNILEMTNANFGQILLE